MIVKLLSNKSYKRFITAASIISAVVFLANPVFAQTVPRCAVITAFDGSVLIQAKGQSVAVPARKNMEIKSGDRIITGGDGSAEILFDDRSVSRIGPQSRIDIKDISRREAGGGGEHHSRCSMGEYLEQCQRSGTAQFPL